MNTMQPTDLQVKACGSVVPSPSISNPIDDATHRAQLHHDDVTSTPQVGQLDLQSHNAPSVWMEELDAAASLAEFGLPQLTTFSAQDLESEDNALGLGLGDRSMLPSITAAPDIALHYPAQYLTPLHPTDRRRHSATDSIQVGVLAPKLGTSAPRGSVLFGTVSTSSPRSANAGIFFPTVLQGNAPEKNTTETAAVSDTVLVELDLRLLQFDSKFLKQKIGYETDKGMSFILIVGCALTFSRRA